MKISRYTKLGALVIFSIIVLIWGINYLKGIDVFKNNTIYYVVYDHIDGLKSSGAITVNGYQVGQVKSVGFANSHDGSLLVTLSLQGDLALPHGTVARIESSDLMGTKSIKLLVGKSQGFYQSGDTIPGSVEKDLKEQVSMQVLPLKNKAEQLLASLDSAITVVNYVFNDESRKNIRESFAHINRTIINLEGSSLLLNQMLHQEKGNIATILQNMKVVTTVLNKSSANFENISRNISSISDSISKAPLKSMLTNLSGSVKSLNAILDSLHTGKGTAGKLLNDNELYTNLTDLSHSLDFLLRDIQANPKRYVHFSAFDLGKDVYISPQQISEIAGNSKYTFKVHLISSKQPVDTASTIFKSFRPVEVMKISGIYNYLTGNSHNPSEIIKISQNARKIFPDAGIVAFKNGKQINLEKALRKTSR